MSLTGQKLPGCGVYPPAAVTQLPPGLCWLHFPTGPREGAQWEGKHPIEGPESETGTQSEWEKASWVSRRSAFIWNQKNTG